jgi:uncharacterized damage-inducible protein DinB
MTRVQSERVFVGCGAPEDDVDLLDRLLGHDAWTTRHLLERCKEVDRDGLRRPFDLGHGSLLETIEHLVENVEVWTALMRGQPSEARTGTGSLDDLIGRFDAAYGAFADIARTVRDGGAWDETYRDVLDDPPRPKSFGGTITHVVTHNMAHRAEVLHMLRRLGMSELIEGDALSWENRHGPVAPDSGGGGTAE